MESSYRGKVPKLPMAKGKLTWRLSMAPKFPVVNAIEEIIVIIIIIIIITIIITGNSTIIIINIIITITLTLTIIWMSWLQIRSTLMLPSLPLC